MTRGRKVLIAVLAVVLLLVAARVALPFFVQDFVNRKLQALEAYDGHVGDIDVALWRGAYSIDGIEIVKTGARQPVPFFRAQQVDFSIEWRSLFEGSIVSEAVFYAPELNLVQSKSEENSQLGKEVNWNARLEELFPTRFNTIRVVNGTVTFTAPGISTRDAITAKKLNGIISNLTNVVDSQQDTFAGFRVTAEVLDGAPASVAGSANPLAAQPTFDVNLQVKQIKLPQANPWLREYIKADAEAGSFELYLEIAAADGKFSGYAKPILQDVELYRSGEEEQSALKRLWEGFLDFAAEVLENEDADQVAARVPFTGTIENPETSLFATIASVLRNAFVSAFARSLEGSISLRDVKRNLQDIDPTPPPEEKKSRDGASEKPKPARESGNPKL